MKKLSIVLIIAAILVGSLAVFAACDPVSGDFTYRLDEKTKEVTITGFRNNDAQSVEIPSQIEGNPVVTIANEAFYNKNNLVSITLPEGLKVIKSKAFYSCTNLETINFPDSIYSIESNAFSLCTKLKPVTMSAGIRFIGEYAFYGCKEMTSFTFADEYKEAEYTVADQQARESAEDSTKKPYAYITIDNMAFLDCNLKTFTVPAYIERIGYSFIGRNVELESVTFLSLNTLVKQSSSQGSEPMYAMKNVVKFPIGDNKFQINEKLKIYAPKDYYDDNGTEKQRVTPIHDATNAINWVSVEQCCRTFSTSDESLHESASRKDVNLMKYFIGVDA